MRQRMGDARRVRTLRRSSVLGIFIIMMGALQLALLPLASCGDLPRSYDLIVALELARSSSDLSLVFGHAATECTRALATKLELLNAFDTLLFVPLYAYFLWSCVQALEGENRALGTALKRLVVTAAVADLTENFVLQVLTSRPFSSSATLVLLPWATGVKWSSLGLINLGLALLYHQRSTRPMVGNTVVVVGVGSCLLALLTQASPPTFGPWLAAGTSAGWLTWLVLGSVHYWNERSLV